MSSRILQNPRINRDIIFSFLGNLKISNKNIIPSKKAGIKDIKEVFAANKINIEYKIGFLNLFLYIDAIKNKNKIDNP